MGKILLNPGPTNTSFLTKLAQWLGSDVCHRTKEFSNILESVQGLLLQHFGDTERSVAVMGGSGTTSLESMLASLAPNETTVINAGVYGSRAIDIFSTLGIEYKEILCNNIDELKIDKEVKFVHFVENETSTGEKFHIHKMADIYPNAKFFIDATSSFGATDYQNFIERIAAISFCSNKCLQSTPGLGAVIWDKNLEIYFRSYYGCLSKYGVGKLPFTLPVQSVRALNHVLRRECKNKNKFDKRRERLVNAFKNINIQCINKYPSNSIIGFIHPNKSYNELRIFLDERGIVVYSGIQGIKNSFRVSTMSVKFDCKFSKIVRAFRDSCIY